MIVLYHPVLTTIMPNKKKTPISDTGVFIVNQLLCRHESVEGGMNVSLRLCSSERRSPYFSGQGKHDNSFRMSYFCFVKVYRVIKIPVAPLSALAAYTPVLTNFNSHPWLVR